MTITAVYYCKDSSPYKMFSLDLFDMEDDRLKSNDSFKATLWEIFEEERQENEYPQPSSDVVFLYTEQFRSSTIAAQIMNQDDY
jgi:hypothetical protein